MPNIDDIAKTIYLQNDKNNPDKNWRDYRFPVAKVLKDFQFQVTRVAVLLEIQEVLESLTEKTESGTIDVLTLLDAVSQKLKNPNTTK